MKCIGFASDHAGFELKAFLMEYMRQKGYEVKDFGTYSSESCDYPDFAHPLASAVESGECIGFAICGTGNGMSMTANKHANVRAGLCWSADIAALARQHNNANVLVLPARFIPAETAFDIVDTFFHTGFEGGRHMRRVEKINL